MIAFVNDRDRLIQATVPRYSVPLDRALMLTATATMFEVSVGGVPTPETITFSALMLGAVGDITFSSDPPTPLTVANGVAVLNFTDMTTSVVTITASTVIEGITYIARQTVAKQQALDLTPPPAPIGLVVTGQPATITLAWNAAPTNYSNLSHTEVWRAPANNFAQATLVGRADGHEYIDPVGPGVFRYYWIRYVSRADIPGPYNASSGTVGASDDELTHTLQLLLNKLGYEQFDVASGVFPVRMETTLPTLPDAKYPPGVLVTLSTNGKLYRNVGNTWTAEVQATDITGQITGSQIAGSSLDVTKFASGIEPVTNVASVPSTKLTSTILNTTDGKLYRWNGSAYVATVPTTDLTGQITAAQLAAGAVDLTKFASGIEPVTNVDSVPSTKSTSTILNTTDGKLYRWNGSAYVATVPVADLTGQITAANIAANTITAAQIAADTITAGQIAAGAITASELAVGAVTAGKIAAGSIVAADVAVGTLTGDRIAGTTITAANIAANTITAAQIAADTITAGQIAAGAITASEVAAGAITTDKLAVVSRGSALNPDPNFDDVTAWTLAGGMRIDSWPGVSGTKALISSVNKGASTASGRVFPLTAGKTYRISVLLSSYSSPGTAYVLVARLNIDGTPIANSTGIENVTAPLSTWQEFSGVFTAEPGTVTGSVQLYLNWPSSGDANTAVLAQNVKCEEVVGSTLIQDGAITTSKIFAGAVDTDKLAANAVTAGKIAAGSIVAGDGVIANAAIGTAQIIDASIGNAKIGGDIWSSNYVAGSSGWRLYRSGNLETNDIHARGTVTGGGFTNVYDWPTNGQGGFHLSASGLLIGNARIGGYFQVEPNGDVYTPGFTIVNSVATFSGALSAATGSFSLIRSPARSGGTGAGYDFTSNGLYFYDGVNSLPYIELGEYIT